MKDNQLKEVKLMIKLKVVVITAVIILGGIMFAWQNKKESIIVPTGAKARELHTEPC